jgi:NitT/TauT family transport system ATP-binding protein
LSCWGWKIEERVAAMLMNHKVNVSPEQARSRFPASAFEPQARASASEVPISSLRPTLVLREVCKSFEVSGTIVEALRDVSLTVAEGEFVCLVGPSGCGKSTLLDIIAGLTKPDRGHVLMDGKPVQGSSGRCMVMFQEPALFPWLDVLGNVMFGLKLRPDLSNREQRQTAEYFVRLVGLAEFQHACIHELSGGMKQRVALARALAPDPHVLLMDEPFGALDALTRDQLYQDLQRIWAQRRKTILLVTHNVREAACLGDRVMVMSARPGTIARGFDIPLSRPRDINSPELASYASDIAEALKDVIG